ncbi:MAG: glycosyltransferase family 4 protein [Caldiserica bacterium]|jgi:glycosyltransferase involved in cell wall biosynthesis|nr:glycosyltransferase family 4 protein [Caldisericota bacterium]MDH7563092.1 glycosyltransferase family 4 protein [Caldisericota bacterium]
MSRKLKILQVIGGGEIAGSKHQFLELCLEQLKRGHEIAIVCFIEGELSEDARKMGIPITVLPMANIADWRVIPLLQKRIREGGYQIVHTHGVRANFIGRIAARRTGAHIITTIYSFPKEDYKNILKRTFYPPIDRLTVKFAERLIVVSHGLKERLIQVRYAPEEKLRVVHCSLDLEKTKPTKTRAQMREELGIPDNAPSCGMLARLVHVKNPFLLLEVAQKVNEEIPEAMFFFVGDGPYLNDLQRETLKRGLQRTVKFTGFRKDPLDVVEALDVIVLTSLSEGLPVTLLEAMALKKPVVATRVGGVPEVVKDGVTGFLVPSGDSQGFSRVLISLFKNHDLMREMGERGRKWVEENFSLSTMAEKTDKVYFEVLEE